MSNALKDEVFVEKIKSSRPCLIKMWSDLKKEYQFMGKLVFAMLILPSTSCCVERLFSRLKLTKTGPRNRLLTEHLESILLCKEYFNKDGIEFTEEMYEKYTNMWHREQNNSLLQIQSSASDSKKRKPDNCMSREEFGGYKQVHLTDQIQITAIKASENLDLQGHSQDQNKQKE